MEKSYEYIKGLAREVFDTQRFPKRITKHGDWMIVHSRGFVSRIIMDVDITNDVIYYSHIRDEKRVKDFEQRYQERFLHGKKHTTLKFMKGISYLRGSL